MALQRFQTQLSRLVCSGPEGHARFHENRDTASDVEPKARRCREMRRLSLAVDGNNLKAFTDRKRLQLLAPLSKPVTFSLDSSGASRQRDSRIVALSPEFVMQGLEILKGVEVSFDTEPAGAQRFFFNAVSAETP